ncbi:MAG: hypothetical protein IT289_03665 [Oligoflexia bacterium]|nr:hypothetical protein [Oligoflexia bacterium]
MKTLLLLPLIYSLAATAPNCPRPLDMNEEEKVSAYWQCLEKKQQFCEKNLKVAGCPAFLAGLKAKQPPSFEPAQINPQDLCSIQKTGAYICRQQPFHLIVKEKPKDQPISLPAQSRESGETPPEQGQTPKQAPNAAAEQGPASNQEAIPPELQKEINNLKQPESNSERPPQ